MKLIYLDEAGNTGSKADPDQPIHLIGCLLIDPKAVPVVERELDRIVSDHLDKLFPGEATTSASRVELHGSALYNGKEDFRNLKPADRVAICKSVLQICKENGARVGWCAVNKSKLYTSRHPHSICFQFIIESVQKFLKDNSVLGLIIADEHRELEEDIIQDHRKYKNRGTTWGYKSVRAENIIDSVHFVKSKHNRVLQACDVVTYFSLKGYKTKSRHHSDWTSANAAEPISFEDYVRIRASLADRAVLELYASIQEMLEFKKIWPKEGMADRGRTPSALAETRTAGHYP